MALSPAPARSPSVLWIGACALVSGVLLVALSLPPAHVGEVTTARAPR